MDPLSVAASVAGLVRVAGLLVPELYNLGSTVKEANKDAQAAATEVAGMSIVLQGLQTYIIGRTRANPQRLRLITVEHITASLTACVFTYSELDAVLKALHADSGLKAWDRAKWFLKRESVQRLVVRLQNHKASFTCMLNILQCESAGEAESSMDRLCDQVDLLLKENKELSSRLRNLEHLSGGGSSRRSIASLAQGGTRQDNISTSAHSTTSRSSHVQSLDSCQSQTAAIPAPMAPTGTTNEPPRVSAFEEQLHRSRVYRHAQANHSESSLVEDGRSTLALSICSSLTLGEVSNVSVFALPIFAAELSNASAYTFARPSEAAKIDAPGQRLLQCTDDLKPKVDDTRKSLGAYFRIKFRTGQAKSTNERLGATIEAPPGVFGVPLGTSIRYANVAISLFNDEGQSYISGYIPIVLAKTGVFLKDKGTRSPQTKNGTSAADQCIATDVENIFATGSSLRRISELQLAFDSPDRYGKNLSWTGYTFHDAANVLLRYLLQLPEPVIPLELYERFRMPLRIPALADAIDTETTIRAFQTLIAELVPLWRNILRYLLDLLAVFASKSDLNKMTVSKLAAIFQPCLLSHPQHNLSPVEQQLSRDAVYFSIENEESFQEGVAGGELHDETS